jgi:hypothetical protein
MRCVVRCLFWICSLFALFFGSQDPAPSLVTLVFVNSRIFVEFRFWQVRLEHLCSALSHLEVPSFPFKIALTFRGTVSSFEGGID